MSGNASYAAQHCSVSASTMSFPPYDIFETAPVHSQADISVLCEQNLLYSIKVSSGLNASGDFSRRQMNSLSDNSALFYNLFLDSGYSRIWGDGTGFSEFYSGSGQGRPEIIRIFGRIMPTQKVSAGTYSDSVVISIEW